MTGTVDSMNRLLRIRLSTLLHDADTEGLLHIPDERTLGPRVTSRPGVNANLTDPVHVVITPNEVNNLHGTGPLVRRICSGWQNVFSMRTRNDWGGLHEFGDWHVCLSQHNRSRVGFFSTALTVLQGRTTDSVFCVPFTSDELLTAIAVQASFAAKLCAYIMDDQNVATGNIPDELMYEFLRRCALRLVTHPELRYAYEKKYRLPFYILPAVVPGSLVATDVVTPPPVPIRKRRGAIIGSFWDQSWFDRLCSALAQCQWEIDWFGNNKSPWFELSQNGLDIAGIRPHGIIPEYRLAVELRKYPFVIVPVSALDDRESNHGVARLSLPGRILFALATSQTPILVVGSPSTCAARFVTHFGIGDVASYDAAEIADAMARLSTPEKQRSLREQAAAIAPSLSDDGVSDWLAESIERGAPADLRFEELFAGYDPVLDIDNSDARSGVSRD